MSWLEKLLPPKIQPTDPAERRSVPEAIARVLRDLRDYAAHSLRAGSGDPVDERFERRLEPRADAFDGPRPTKAAQLPYQICLGRDVEHHLGAAQRTAHAAGERLVAENTFRLGLDDRVIVHVDRALTDGITEIRHTTRPLEPTGSPPARLLP